MLKSFITLLFSLNFQLVSSNEEILQSATTENEYTSICTCLTKILNNEATWQPTIVLKKSVNEEFDKEILKELIDSDFPYIIVDNETSISYFEEQSIFVSYIEDIRSILALNEIIAKRRKYLFILDELMNKRKDINEIGNTIGPFDISIFVKNTKDYNIFTFIPKMKEKTCDVVTRLRNINQCSNGELRSNLIFPVKNPTNMKKCPLKVGIGSLYPFAMIENKDTLKTYDRLNNVTGLDVEIIKIAGEYFNASLELYYIRKVAENPYTDIEFINFLVNGSLDICAGGLYRIYGDIVEYSGIYLRQAVVWMYTVDRPEKSWQNLVQNVNGIYIFIIFYVIYSVIWYLVSKFDKKAVSLTETFLYGWGALTGASSLQEPSTFKQRILNILYLYMCLHLSAYVNVQLYSFLTIKGPPQLFDTNKEIMESGRTAYLMPKVKYFTTDERYVRFADLSQDCYSFEDCAEKSLLYKGITILIQGYFYYLQADTAVNDEAKVLSLSENMLTVYYEMSIRKNGHVAKKFQKLIERLFEAGIPERLYSEIIGISAATKAKIVASNIMSNSYSCQSGCTISFSQFLGAFYVWGIGCCLSFCLLILEIVFKRENRSLENW